MNFARMVAQLSKFTIHPTPQQGNSIPELLPDAINLVRYIIPANSKEKLLRDLAALGVTQGTLFPDLDSLSVDIVYEHKVIAYTPPEPPKFEQGGVGTEGDFQYRGLDKGNMPQHEFEADEGGRI
jgi:hypothetical protein